MNAKEWIKEYVVDNIEIETLTPEMKKELKKKYVGDFKGVYRGYYFETIKETLNFLNNIADGILKEGKATSWSESKATAEKFMKSPCGKNLKTGGIGLVVYTCAKKDSIIFDYQEFLKKEGKDNFKERYKEMLYLEQEIILEAGEYNIALSVLPEETLKSKENWYKPELISRSGVEIFTKDGEYKRLEKPKKIS